MNLYEKALQYARSQPNCGELMVGDTELMKHYNDYLQANHEDAADLKLILEVKNRLIEKGKEWEVKYNDAKREIERLERTITQNLYGWVLCSLNLPPEGIEVLGYSLDWVDEDFNPDGIRPCLYYDNTWSSAKWDNDKEAWYTDWKTKPEYWKHRPDNPSKSLWVGKSGNPLGKKEASKSDGPTLHEKALSYAKSQPNCSWREQGDYALMVHYHGYIAGYKDGSKSDTHAELP